MSLSSSPARAPWLATEKSLGGGCGIGNGGGRGCVCVELVLGSSCTSVCGSVRELHADGTPVCCAVVTQGDEEKRLGLPISFLCDRSQHDTEFFKSQIGFLDFVVKVSLGVEGRAPSTEFVQLKEIASPLDLGEICPHCRLDREGEWSDPPVDFTENLINFGPALSSVLTGAKKGSGAP